MQSIRHKVSRPISFVLAMIFLGSYDFNAFLPLLRLSHSFSRSPNGLHPAIQKIFLSFGQPRDPVDVCVIREASLLFYMEVFDFVLLTLGKFMCAGKLGHRLLSPADQAFKYDAVSFFIHLVLGLMFQIVAMCINPKPPQTCNMYGRLVAELVASEAIIYLCDVPAPAFGKGLV